MLSIIVAIAQNNAIGKAGQLLYHLPNDLKRFKVLTTGHTIIMGRKTFESLPNGALPNRQNLVLSHDTTLSLPGAEVFPTLEAVLATCPNNEEIFVIGGVSVYRQALPFADKLYITLFDDNPMDADTFFPSPTTVNDNPSILSRTLLTTITHAPTPSSITYAANRPS